MHTFYTLYTTVYHDIMFEVDRQYLMKLQSYSYSKVLIYHLSIHALK